MLKLFRFLTALLLLVWLGVMIANTFYVAPSLFNNESGQTPTSSIAGDVIGPLLHKMYLTGWIVLPLAIGLHAGMRMAAGRRAGRTLTVSAALLTIALISQIYAGGVLEKQIHNIRVEMKAEFGGYHLAPDDHPERQRFSRLHGLSMMLVMVDLIAGLGAFFCVTQLVPLRSEAAGPIARVAAAPNSSAPSNPRTA